jgi:hypothetical protein
MILTIDTDKETPQSLAKIARFLQELASQAPAAESAEDFSFSEEAFSAVFSGEEPKKRDDDDFKVLPY